MTERVKIPEGEVILLPSVQGLVRERERVRDAWARERFAAVALGVSPEDAASLLRYEPNPEVDLFDDLPDHDLVYSVQLRAFGAVELPPPGLLEAARLARDSGVPLYGVDMPEEAYETAFTKTVSTLGFLRYGRIQRSLAKRPPRAPDAETFALEWDRRIRRVKGLRIMEARREAHMAGSVRALAKQAGGPVLFIVDYARAEGIRAAWRQPPA